MRGTLKKFRLVQRSALLIVLIAVASMLPSIPAQAAQPQVAWVSFASGAAYTWLPYYTTSGNFKGNIFAVRIAPGAAIFRIYYHIAKRQTVQRWAVELPGAAVIVNGGFFDSAGRAVGLVKLGDDILSRATGRSDSGVFSIEKEMPHLGAMPITTPTPNSGYAESLESFPLLINNQQRLQFVYNPDERRRRSVIAQDVQGNVVIIYSSLVDLSLPEMIAWIQASGLNITTALNLDGGSSSELHIAAPGDFSQLAQGNARVPTVLAVYLR